MNYSQSTWWRPATAALLVLAAAALWLAAAGNTQAGSDGSVTIDPAQQDVGVGGQASIDVNVVPPASGLSIWIVQISYDPTKVQVALDGSNNPMCTVLASPGGGAAFAAGCATKDTNSDATKDTLVFFGGLVSNEGGVPHGLESAATIGSATFNAVGAEGDQADLTILTGASLNFLGPNGETPTPALANGAINIVEVQGTARVWGDVDCNGSVNPVDSLKILRADAGFSDTPPTGCPAFSSTIAVTGFSAATKWGDGDCNGSVNPVDSLKTLRADAGFSDTPAANCPALKANVTVSP